MAKAKLPPAKAWQERKVSDWNTVTFTHYLSHMNDKHFRTAYYPMRNWTVERGMIKTAIDAHGAEVIKRFIDEAFATHTITNPNYPGLSFGFIWAYRKNVLQKVIREDNLADERKKREQAEFEARMKALAETGDDLDWI